jgi:hypothetical protein
MSFSSEVGDQRAEEDTKLLFVEIIEERVREGDVRRDHDNEESDLWVESESLPVDEPRWENCRVSSDCSVDIELERDKDDDRDACRRSKGSFSSDLRASSAVLPRALELLELCGRRGNGSQSSDALSSLAI